MKLIVCLIPVLLSISVLFSQKVEVSTFASSGIVLGGYVDQGIYLNFTGPGIKTQKGKSEVLIGFLPSLRLKEDNGSTKNALVIPSLGFGITYVFKSIAIQVPFYYKTKTSNENGRWKTGIGIGMKITDLFEIKKSNK